MHDPTSVRSGGYSPVIIVSRAEVESRDFSSVLEALQSFITAPARAASFFEAVDISFSGYDHVSDELFEIAEVREFVHALDDQFPFWLFFLDKEKLGLQCLAYCFVPPFLTPAAKQELVPKHFDALLTNRWFPAMNQICEWVGFTEDQIEALTDRSVEYLLTGPSSP